MALSTLISSLRNAEERVAQILLTCHNGERSLNRTSLEKLAEISICEKLLDILGGASLGRLFGVSVYYDGRYVPLIPHIQPYRKVVRSLFKY